MFDLVEIRNRDGEKINVRLDTTRIPHDDFGEYNGVIYIGNEPYVLVADMADDPRKGDIEGRAWRLVHPREIKFPQAFFERENCEFLIGYIAPHISREKLEKIKTVLEGDDE